MIVFSSIITVGFIVWGLVRKKSKLVSFALLLLLFVLFAFEKTTGDYQGYLTMYDEISRGSGRALTYEILYVLLCRVGVILGLSFNTLRAYVVILELIFLYSVIKKYTENTAMVLSLFFIFPAMLDAELFRWLLGMCIVIFGIQFILNEKTIRNVVLFCASIAVASMFHTSCWIFLIYLLLMMQDTRRIRRVVIIVLIIGIAFLSTGVFFNLLSHLPIRVYVIEKYQTGNYSNWHGILFDLLKQLLILFMGIVATGRLELFGRKLIMRKENQELVLSSNKIKLIKDANLLNNQIINLNLVSFLILIPLYYSSSVQRLTHVVVFFNYIALANRCDNNENAHTHTLFCIAISILLLLSLLFLESEGAVYAFTSHFTEGYFTNLFSQ